MLVASVLLCRELQSVSPASVSRRRSRNGAFGVLVSLSSSRFWEKWTAPQRYLSSKAALPLDFEKKPSSRVERELAVAREKVVRLWDLQARNLFYNEGPWSRMLASLCKDGGKALACLNIRDLRLAAAASGAFLDARRFPAEGTEETAHRILLRLVEKAPLTDKESFRLLRLLQPLLSLHPEARRLEVLQRNLWESALAKGRRAEGGVLQTHAEENCSVEEKQKEPREGSGDFLNCTSEWRREKTDEAVLGPFSFQEVTDDSLLQIAISVALLLPGLHCANLDGLGTSLNLPVWTDFASEVFCFSQYWQCKTEDDGEVFAVKNSRDLRNAAELCLAVSRLLRLFLQFQKVKGEERFCLVRRASSKCLRVVLASDLNSPGTSPETILTASAATAELSVLADFWGVQVEDTEWHAWKHAISALRFSAERAGEARTDQFDPTQVIAAILQAVRLKYYASPLVFKLVQRAGALNNFFGKGQKAALLRATALMHADLRGFLSRQVGTVAEKQRLLELWELLDSARRTGLFSLANSANVSWTKGQRSRVFT